MAKGGFPVSPIALPLLILFWPQQEEAARLVAGFMLPMLCLMDVFGICFYRKHIRWDLILPMVPGTLLGVLAATVVFLAQGRLSIAVSDRWLKLAVGLIGVGFVGIRLFQNLIRHRTETWTPGIAAGTLLGAAAGITSTVAHAAGPVAQIYFLPQGLPKLQLAGTMVGFFFGLNLVKLIPYSLVGMISAENLLLGAAVAPVIPVGVAAGYGLVRVLKTRSYVVFIYGILMVTSVLLIHKALFAPATG
jgi:hypothetical protein